MSPAAFIDANVPIYAAGRAHGLKAPCVRILMLAAGHPEAFVTDAEVLQELLHRYLALKIWSDGREAFDRFSEIMRDRVESILESDVKYASKLADDHSDSSARDLLHVSVMHRRGLHRIISADKDFDRLPGIERLDPAQFEEWKGTVIGGPVTDSPE